METDIYQKIERDFPNKTEEAISVINELDAQTKGTISSGAIRMLIFDAKGDFEKLKMTIKESHEGELSEKYKDIDFSKTFHDLKLM